MKPLDTLRALGTGGDAPVEAKERVHAAVMASLAAATAGAAGATSAASSVTSQSGSLSAAPQAASSLIAGLTGSKALVIAGGIWLMGGATGAALYGALHQQEVRVVYVDRPVLTASVTAPAMAMPPAVPTQTAPALSASSVPPADPATKRALPTATAHGSDLARERALLDLARANAARGEPAFVLEQTEQHRAQFARGKLAEEREALAIRALLSLGRADEARTRAAAFHLSYPHSLLAPAIDSALSIP